MSRYTLVDSQLRSVFSIAGPTTQGAADIMADRSIGLTVTDRRPMTDCWQLDRCETRGIWAAERVAAYVRSWRQLIRR